MGRRQGLVRMGRRVVALVATMLLVLGTYSCAQPTEPTQLMSEPTVEPNRLSGQLSEVSPPESIQLLKQVIDAYTPQVRILSPRPGEIIEETSVSVRVQVRGLPLFKDETFGLGPHLHVFLDNEPYKAVYDLSKPLEFQDLTPGTHTLRVFASRPWHESFKNQGAFDQRTFHIYAPTPQDELSADQPLLTYSRPQGSYGAEPIMLDFYLTNAPLHMTAQEDPGDDIHDWRIRCTINGQSFVFDQWQSLYLMGFEPGRNWVQLELIDETGFPIDNRFNNTIRIINYEPGGEDTLAKLVRGELDAKAVASILDPAYVPTAKSEPELEPKPEPEAPESVELPAEVAPESAGQEAASPTEPAAPAPGPSPAAPEGFEPNAPEPSAPTELAPKVAPEELKQEAPQAEGKVEPEASVGVPPAEPGAPTVESSPSEVETSEKETSEVMQGPDVAPALPADVPAQSGQDTSNSRGTSPDQEVEALKEESGAEAAAAKASEDGAASGSREPQFSESPEPDKTPEPSTGNKLLERYKQWQRRRSQSAQSEPEQLTPGPTSDRVDGHQSPSPDANAKSDRAEDSGSDDARLDMPDLVEPYLTEPYLTEPRLDFSPPEDAKPDTEGDATKPDQSEHDSGDESGPKEPTIANPERSFI